MNLTDREKEILDLMCLDYSGKMIAGILEIKHGTVKNAKTSIYKKLGVNSGCGAIYKYLCGTSEC